MAYPQAERQAWDGDVFGSDGSVVLPPFPLAGSLPTDPAGVAFLLVQGQVQGPRSGCPNVLRELHCSCGGLNRGRSWFWRPGVREKVQGHCF